MQRIKNAIQWKGSLQTMTPNFDWNTHVCVCVCVCVWECVCVCVCVRVCVVYQVLFYGVCYTYVYCVSESRLEGCSSIEVSGWDWALKQLSYM